MTTKDKPTAKVQYSIYNLVDYVSVCTHCIQMLYRYQCHHQPRSSKSHSVTMEICHAMQGASIWDLSLPKAKSYSFSSHSVNYTWLESFVLSIVSLRLQQGIKVVSMQNCFGQRLASHVELLQAEISHPCRTVSGRDQPSRKSNGTCSGCQINIILLPRPPLYHRVEEHLLLAEITTCHSMKCRAICLPRSVQ